jgi:RHS repeat-associated protein
VDYLYFASGKVKQAKTGNATTSMEYDSSFGDQTSLTDPNTGKTTYGYNGFSELNYQKDQKEQVINLTYNTQGQLTQKRGTGISIIYGYYTDGTKKGLLQSVDRDGVHESYEYDEINRLKKVTNSGAGKTFYTSYTYNSKGQLWTLEYPTGLIVEYKYDNVGNLCQILNAKDHSNIWTGNTKNDIDQWTWFSLGNGLNTYYGYDDNNFINSIKTGPNGAPTNIQNLGFIFNKQGQLTSRSEGTLSESFQYNSQNCLTLSTLQSQTPVSWQVDYLSNGNIDKTSLGGQYSYLADKINAVSKVEGVTSTGQSTPLVTSTTYNIDNKPLIMDNGTYKNIFSYGPDGNRFKCDMYQGGNLKSSKIYVSNNEFLLDASRNITASRTFIYAPTGICAVYEKNASDQESFYYIHTDYLGSWLSITNQQGALVNSYSYDAWGRPRDPSTWQLKPISITNALADLNTMQPRFDRGYTGHEHMTGFGLINMNGRLYDPYLQRFLSPDIYVQDPENGQSYNRYSYCMNNPLSYTDPSGYSWLSNFGNWVSKTANQFGNWLNENHISVQGGYSTSSGNFWGGTPFIGAAANGGNFLNVGYSISNGNVGIGNSNGGLTNFWYPSYNYNSPEQNAMSSINSIRASAGDAWLMNSTTSNGASLEYSSFVGNGLWIDGKSGFMLNSWGNYNAYVNCYSNGKVLYYMLRSAQGQGGSGWVNDANNVNTGLGVGSGVFGGNYGLTANQTFRYAQRINGRVVSAAELTAAHAAQSMKVANALGRINVITGVLGTGYSAAKVYSDYNKGGWNNVNGLDVADAGVGAGGLVVSGLVTLGLVSNPVGWCIGIGTGIYFGARLIYDLSKD